MIKEKCRGAVDPGGDVAAGCFISGGFAGAPLESAGFLLFFYPQPNSLPCPAPFFISSSFPSFHAVSPSHWLLCDLRNHTFIPPFSPPEKHSFLIFNTSLRHFFSDLCVLEVTSWQGFFKRWDCEKGEGSEARGGEQLTSVSVLVEEFGNYWTLSSISLSLSSYKCPDSELTGKLHSAILNAPNVYNFLCKEPGLEKQKQTGTEGRGKWEVTEARAWRAQMGNGGEVACVWEGSGVSGGIGRHTWFWLLTAMRFMFLLFPNSTAT